MTEKVEFQSDQTGKDAPAAPPADKTPAGAAPGERPAWLPADFKGTPDEYVASLAKSQADTKAELTRAQQELAKGKKPAEDKKPTTEVSDKKPGSDKAGDLEVPEEGKDEGKTPDGVDFAPYTDEFNRTGDVSQESRGKIAESLKGILGEHAAEVVNDYIDGRKAHRDNSTSQIKAIAGGDQGYAEMVGWAKTNLSAEERGAFNKAVNSGDFHSASLAVQGLKSKFDASNGKTPSLVTGDNNILGQGGFTSVHQLVEAQRDPRYGKDPDYTKQVQDKLSRSNI